jgi:hypothetical protein
MSSNVGVPGALTPIKRSYDYIYVINGYRVRNPAPAGFT